MASDKERMLAGQSYNAGDAELVADRQRCRVLTDRLNTLGNADPVQREELLRGLLGSLGERTEVLSPFHCDYGYRIEIGDRTLVNFGAVILDSALVRIGDDVQIGPSVQLVTPTHPLDPELRSTGIECAAPITIGDQAWLATGVIVCRGVTIGEGAVIGAGSVVTHDMPARHLCLGSPCRVVRPV
jgi:maltose O-acetyltransferase